MKTSEQWFSYFSNNLQISRINWNQQPGATKAEIDPILPSLQAWQLGETSDGSNLIKAAKRYAAQTGDLFYVKAVELFIKEEQKHGANLGRYLDMIEKPRLTYNWGDALFRKIRHLNTSMEWWTITVITVECAAQIFYQSLKDATGCNLLKEICTDILIDEAPHIQFQQERLRTIFMRKSGISKLFCFYWYKYFYLLTAQVIWMAHKNLFKAGNNHYAAYNKKMKLKFSKTIGRLKTTIHANGQYQNKPSPSLNGN
ncbi:ferritin-like domain-containing protein [Foetidibacter luteolus]|uniref:ferritin-like domain-containing protein n=1 Tax=Foetidibacter luteolus TaxID=2608880 RepID=UPI001A98949A|nr:ferritin-like domain-containing protein [Foetidibacter luteolus]